MTSLASKVIAFILRRVYFCWFWKTLKGKERLVQKKEHSNFGISNMFVAYETIVILLMFMVSVWEMQVLFAPKRLSDIQSYPEKPHRIDVNVSYYKNSWQSLLLCFNSRSNFFFFLTAKLRFCCHCALTNCEPSLQVHSSGRPND